MSEDQYRLLPSVDRVLADARFAAHSGDRLVTAVVRETLEAARARIAAGEPAPAYEAVVADALRRLQDEREPPLRPLINATGVILHTNLGRAPLAVEAVQAMAASSGYGNLELDLASGRRGSRHALLAPLVRRLTGAEAAIAVNNNAAAVLLALSALCARREVVISRGELVEIGGGFRVPDVMRQSGAKLVEVGTTNRTRLADYADAIGPRTAALMRVHASNFRIRGFTEAPALDALAALAHERGVLLIDDLGSGCLLDTTSWGLPAEPRPQDAITAGADVVLFSGDKLLGGPQAGIAAGRRERIDTMRRHPLARAVRLDKSSIAGLAATLRLYAEGRAEERLPVWRMIAAPVDALAARARAIAATVPGAEVRDARAAVGGGALPDESLPSKAVGLPAGSGARATRLLAALRARGVIARIEDDAVLLDVRTIDPGEDARAAAALREALASSG